ncbi:MAG: extracellular solute-binding protein [Verrucomicrobia bacterium]|nr:extracellular solute-binding protein [Verrucomicrobiota bacterium]
MNYVVGFVAMTYSDYRDRTMRSQRRVILYTSQDKEFAEPILREFEAKTSFKVRAVFDSEAVKTVGLANRLLAERAHPQCDVFWSNEELRTRQLAAMGLFNETNDVREFGYRSRRIVINTNLVSLATSANALAPSPPSPPFGAGERAGVRGSDTRPSPPRSLLELTNAAWRGKVALAYPLFGTTASHFLALRAHWGSERWESWCRALAANKPFLVDGNSVVVKLVGRGEAAIGLTDSDDIAAAQREGLPVAALPMTPETLLIENTAAVLKNAPHPAAAQKLLEFLQSKAVTDRLIKAGALEGECACDVNEPTLAARWPEILRDLEPATAKLKEIFLR